MGAAFGPVDRHGEIVLRLLGFMRAHFREPLDLARLAKVANLSPNHTAMVFRGYMGKSPIETLIGLRIEESRRLLRLRERSIQEIAWEVGYEDAAYFSRLFRRRCGLSPREYRHEHEHLV